METNKTPPKPQTTTGPPPLPGYILKPKTRLYILAFYVLASSRLDNFIFKNNLSQTFPQDFSPEANNPQDVTPKPDIDINIDEITNLSIQLKHNKILASRAQEQRFPMLVSLEAKDLEDSYRKPVDLVCIIDSSPRMNDEKIEFVRNTLRYLLTFLNEEDRISIIISNEQDSTLVPLTKTSPKNKEIIISALQTLDLRGRSLLKKSLLSASQAIERDRLTGVLVISEELDNPDNNMMMIWSCKPNRLHLTSTHLSRDIFLMAKIHSLTDDNVFALDRLNNVDEAFAFIRSLEIFKTSIAENVEFFIKTPASEDSVNGIEIAKAYGDKSPWSTEDGVFRKTSKSLVTGGRKNFVLDLKIPSFPQGLPNDGPMEVTVANCEATLTLRNGSKVVKKAELKVMLVEDEAELGIGENNERVRRNFYRAGAELMVEAERLECLSGEKEGIHETWKELGEIIEDEKMIERLRKDKDPQESRAWLTVTDRNHLKFFRRIEL